MNDYIKTDKFKNTYYTNDSTPESGIKITMSKVFVGKLVQALMDNPQQTIITYTIPISKEEMTTAIDTGIIDVQLK